MSRLEYLIEEYCPDGVETVAVATLIRTGTVKSVIPTIKIKRNDYKVDGQMPIVSQEEEFISGYCNVIDKNITKRNYVCFGDHSEHIKYVDFAFVQGADGLKIMFTDEQCLVAKFFYYAISNNYFRRNSYERHFKYLGETEIPVPPLPVQREIVRILDNFTELTAKLTAELTAELIVLDMYTFL